MRVRLKPLREQVLVMGSSVYTQARLHRGRTLLGFAIAGATLALLDRMLGDGD